jgi:polysaccharide deacetylase family protein (PEP-CTERM system associated)
MKSIMSVDVEDWFHILDVSSAPKLPEWSSLPSRVERNLAGLLDLFDEKGVKVTCFFLGWIAEHHRAAVLDAARRGHEIASHGYSHRLVYEMSPEAFLQDAMRSRKLLEDIAGCPVLGYRSAGFSTTEESPWFFDKLIEAGYKYDSSVFPAPRQHGGLRTDRYGPYAVTGSPVPFIEFPISVRKVIGSPVCFFGGGYLRLFPYPLIKSMAAGVLGEGRPVIFYVHPREIDPGQPRLKMSIKRRFKSYVNLATTEAKLRRIAEEFELTTFAAYLLESRPVLEVE